VVRDTVIRSTLESRSPVPVTFYTEYLDLNLFDGSVPLPELRELLRRKYQSRPLDLIVASASSALRVAVLNRADLFWNAPIVFASVDPTAAADLRLDADVTGTWLHQGWVETLELARGLQPEIRRAVVVTGSSPVDRIWMTEAHRQFAAARSIEVTYLSDLSLADVLTEVRSLPRQTVVLVGVFFQDASGRDFTTPEAIRQIAAAASVPVYGLTEAAIGAGAIGGHVLNFEADGQAVADLARRVLAGERPPPTNEGTTVPMFDGRQLVRWRFDPRRLPPGSLVLFQEPSLWARYRWYIIGGVAALLAQSGLIGALLVQHARRHRAEKRLAERLRFETLLSEISRILVAPDPAGTDLQAQTALRRIVEALDVDWATIRALEPRAPDLWLTHAWTRAHLPPRPAVIPEAETPWIVAQLRQGHMVRIPGLGSLPEEASVDRHSLEAIGARSIVLIPLIRDSAIIGCLSIGTVREVHRWPDEWNPRLQLLAEAFANALERHRAAHAARHSQEAIRSLAGRLLTAQEEERRRIAREIHDGVSQELAAQSIALSSAARRFPDAGPGLQAELERLEARAGKLAEGLRHLSHELHPGILEHVGLVAALQSHCQEVEAEHGLTVRFHADGDLTVLRSDVALCLYRVVQEALRNVVKHGRARAARVALTREDGRVALAIDDDGQGFDPVAVCHRGGLGLVTLDERVGLVGGRLRITRGASKGPRFGWRSPSRRNRMPRTTTLLLADDHAIVAEGLASLLRDEFTLLGTAADGPQLVEAARKLRPDVIVTDLAMPGLSGVDVLRRLRAERSDVKVIVLTMHADPGLAAEALRAGAAGFVVKHAAGRELLMAIREALAGRTYLTPLVTRDVLGTLANPGTPGPGGLTLRQREVLGLIVDGRTMKEIAATLGLSARTVETHKYQVMQKLGVTTTAELIRHALVHGLGRDRTEARALGRN
jgi:DNA-binding NarL/FixJ family response regulator/signal transduction histidine kinase